LRAIPLPLTAPGAARRPTPRHSRPALGGRHAAVGISGSSSGWKRARVGSRATASRREARAGPVPTSTQSTAPSRDPGRVL
jgi:hypothetical protein